MDNCIDYTTTEGSYPLEKCDKKYNLIYAVLYIQNSTTILINKQY
ncbi:MAG: hypothetical protein Q8L27_05105 [archaeon]|nr:hypothetical protein [archaeon]